jgi:dolichyl-phosphate-mannose-protein mannosyltransferase
MREREYLVVSIRTRIRLIYESIGGSSIVYLTWLSLLVHFWQIVYPNSIVFDEVTFGKFLNAYVKGEYYFDLHPPLGKLLLAGIAKVGGINPNFNYDKIGTVYSDATYIWLRSLTAFAGAMIAPCVLILLRGMGFSMFVGLVAGVFVIFENSLVVISRTFVLDIFLLSFGFASLAAGAWYIRNRSNILWALAWLLGASAFSIKWTGLSFLGILSIWELALIWKSRLRWHAYRPLVAGWLLATIFYFLIFVIHFAGTPRSGIGNDFMTADFQSGLVGSRYYNDANLKTPSIFGKFIDLNKMMWTYQKTMKQSHPYASKWYTWPLLQRPIYFWGNTNGEIKERIYLMGNPCLWWASSLALLLLTLKLLTSWWRKGHLAEYPPREFNLLLLYFANFVPFMLIGRVMFIYHYLVALIVGLMILALVLEKLKNRHLAWLFISLSIVTFLFFAPLTYGLPLSDRFYSWRLWFDSWL